MSDDDRKINFGDFVEHLHKVKAIEAAERILIDRMCKTRIDIVVPGKGKSFKAIGDKRPDLLQSYKDLYIN